MSLTFDFETCSAVNLKTQGAYVYAEHPSTDALLASFKLKQHGPYFDTVQGRAVHAWVVAGGPLNVVCRWRRGEPCPPYVRAYVEAGGEIEAHNSTFERLIWWNVMVPRYGWPRPAIAHEKFSYCTEHAKRYLTTPARLRAQQNEEIAAEGRSKLGRWA